MERLWDVEVFQGFDWDSPPSIYGTEVETSDEVLE